MKHAPLIPAIIATGGGIGYWPWGPGTAGAMLATGIWWVLSLVMTPFSLIMTTAGLVLLFVVLGIWSTHQLTPLWGDDPHRVVIDEMVGVWIPLLVATNWQQGLLALVLFRFFDIVKPLGIRALDRRQGAFWVMADDVAAGAYSALILYLIRCLWER